jgi:hypothetical protein
LAGVLDRFGVELDVSEFKGGDIIKVLPFPLNHMLQRDVAQERLAHIVLPIAAMLQVPPTELANDIRDLLNYLRSPSEPQPEKRLEVKLNLLLRCLNQKRKNL